MISYSGVMAPRALVRIAVLAALLCSCALPRTASGTVRRPVGSDCFVANRGQWDARALFLAKAPGARVWLTSTGAVYDVHRPSRDGRSSRGHVVRMEFVGARTSLIGDGLLDGRYNYFIGRDRSRWATNVPRYAEVRAERIAQGVHARWYFDADRPRYDLVVAPGADPRAVTLRFEGASSLFTDGRTLTVGTSVGPLEHRDLYAYQWVNGERRQVPCGFAVRGQTAGFTVGGYDPSRELIIDPLVWSTYLGGDGDDMVEAMVNAPDGSIVVAGGTHSYNFPTSVGAYDQNASAPDAFVAKLSADGSSLVFGTYYGGSIRLDGYSATDVATGVALDPSGNVYLGGSTDAWNLPVTPSAYSVALAAEEDGFVAKFSPNADQLLWATYVGGNGIDEVVGLRLDSARNPVIAGYTQSTNFPSRPGSYDRTPNGKTDGFAAKISASGSSLLWGTYVGGAEDDGFRDFDMDSQGDVVLGGWVNRPGGFFGYSDHYVAKISGNGQSLLWTDRANTANGTGVIWSLDVGPDDDVYIGGIAGSDFVTTPGAYKTTGTSDAFIRRYTSAGNLVYSTLFGGSQVEYSWALQVDRSGSAILAGRTGSLDLPTTPTAVKASTTDYNESYVAKLSPDGSALLYSSYIGGSGSDDIWAATIDAFGNPAVGGETSSPDYQTTPGAFDTSLGGFYDGFVSRVVVPSTVYSLSAPNTSVIGGFAFPATVTLTSFAYEQAQVTVGSDLPSKVLPEIAVVNAGSRQKRFNTKTFTVLSDTPFTLTASCGGLTATLPMVLKPGGLKLLKVDPADIVLGQSGLGTVALSAPAPSGGRTVYLTSTSASVQVPSSVVIQEGKIQATFSVNVPANATPEAASLTARLGTVTKTITVNAIAP